MHDHHRNDPNEPWNEAEGTFEGRSFPSEAEWLDLPVPAIGPDFVGRTLAARQLDLVAHGLADADAASEPHADVAGHLLTPDRLAAHAPPEPSPDFVARTLRSVQDDRQRRWREALAKYVAPEPSSAFVSRTLAALAADQPQRAAAPVRPSRRGWLVPLLAVAASVGILLSLQPGRPLPLEQRLAAAARPSLAVAYATSPLPAVLAALERAADPDGLPSGGADGLQLLLHRRPR